MPGKVHSTTRLFMFLNLTHFISIQGFLSPANRGALMTMAMILFVLLGTPAGYVSARIYKSFGGLKWKSNVILTALFSPGIVFVLFFIMNLVLWYEESSGAVPFSTLLAILALWYVFILIWSRQILYESFFFYLPNPGLAWVCRLHSLAHISDSENDPSNIPWERIRYRDKFLSKQFTHSLFLES